uniref:ATP-dependent DNA helicase n=1 Tax=Leptobrachium leishanense TaxID=445787 RepID=A0A8C5PXT8_9ANUR
MLNPLLFPFGDQSWSPNIKLNYTPTTITNIHTPTSTKPRERVSQMQFYAYMLSIRQEFNPFLSAGKLTQQYFVDAYVKTEGNRLNYVRQNQSKLRVEKYTGLMDHLQNAAHEQGLIPGKAVILPSSFQGSPRNMLQNYQDAMAIVRKYGKPDFFITLTCNPKWPEIAENIKEVRMQAALNALQRETFEDIHSATQNETLPQRCYFLDGPGGSGKTYLYQTLLHLFRGNKEVALAVASTGIGANLLEGGRTYHSQFKLPVPLLDTSTSSMRQSSNDATILRKAKIIIWDESTMAPSDALRCVDKLLQELMKNNKPFGGKTIILGGDFRQTLPVVAHGSRSAIVESSIKFNTLWDKFKIIKLQTNVRSVDPEFSSWLIKLDSIVKEIYGHHLHPDDISTFEKTAILCPKNCDVDNINEEVLSLLEGESYTYLSTDSIDDESQEDRDNYPIEFLNELAPSGMPVHKLKLKIGCIIMLLRNLNTKRGLCNGTRLIVKAMRQNVIIAQVLTPTSERKTVFIPRIDLAPSNTDLPFVLRRRQFPIKLAFAMTINKSQGQTLDRVGIYLPEPVFSHGQLYVAFSRVKSSADVKIKVIDGREQGYLLPGTNACFTKNVVFKEILLSGQAFHLVNLY